MSFLFGADVNVPMVSFDGVAAAPLTLGFVSSVITPITSSSRNRYCFSVPGYQFVAAIQYSVIFINSISTQSVDEIAYDKPAIHVEE